MIRKPSERWINIVVGAWLTIAPWVLGFSDSILVKWSSVLCGTLIVAMNAWFLSVGSEEAKNIK